MIKNSILSPILFLLSLFLFSCSSSEEKKPVDTISVSVKEFKKNVSISDLIAEVNFIPLNYPDSTPLVDATKVIEYKDHFIVFDQFDSKNILRFDKNGNYLLKYGGIGFKPDQFHLPFDIELSPADQSLYVLENPSDLTLKRYDLANGTYKGSITLSKGAKNRFLADRFARTGKNWAFRATGFERQRLILTDSTIKNIISREFDTRTQHLYISYQNYFSNAKNKLLFRMGGCDTIYQVTEKAAVPYRYINFEKKVTDKMYQDARKTIPPEQLLFKLHKAFPGYMHQIYVYQEYGNITYIKFGYDKKLYNLFLNSATGHKIIVADPDLVNNITFQETLLMFDQAENQRDALAMIRGDELESIRQKIKNAPPGTEKSDLYRILSDKKFANGILLRLKFKNF